jgi:hypothetical protein
MMQTLFGWIMVCLVIGAAYPWSAWLLTRSPRRDGVWLTITLTLSLSIGTLTLLMFWESILGIGFTLWGITLPYLVIMLSGLWLWRRTLPQQAQSSVDTIEQKPIRRDAKWLIGALLILISTSILLNAVYWPFYRDDTLGIYHRYGKLMYETGALVPFAGRDDAFYQAYPMQIPLAYTYAYIASAWVNEYLAKTISALFSLACLPAAYLLGRLMYNERTGWLSALLLVLMPAFGRWASSGYVDLPMAFLYTSSAIFAWRLWKTGAWVDAILAGAMMGFAAWTKNAALIGVGVLGLWLLYGWLKRRISLQHLIITFAAVSLVAAPWYIRNYLEARLVVPPTAWTEQAEQTLHTLFIFITQPENFAITGWVLVAGIIATMIEVIRRRLDAPPDILLLLWTVPFFIFWWLFASYDPRFVLLFLPPLCVMGGQWLSRAWDWLPAIWQKRLQLPLAGIAVLMACYMTWISLEYKDSILANPLMDDAAKHEVVLGEK